MLAFSVVRQYDGSTLAIYPKGDKKVMQQVEQMRADERIDMYAEADYSENTTTNFRIARKIEQLENRLRREKEIKTD